MTPQTFLLAAGADDFSKVDNDFLEGVCGIRATSSNDQKMKIAPKLARRDGQYYVSVLIELESTLNGTARSVALDVPEVSDAGPDINDVLITHCISALQELAVQVTTAK